MIASSTSDTESAGLCESCGAAGAVHRVCTIIDEPETHRRLCDAGLRASMAQLMPPGFELPSLEGAVCFYCGRVAMGGGQNQAWEMAARDGQRFHFTCARCGEVFGQGLREALQDFPEGLSPAMQQERLARLTREVDEKVREAVRGDEVCESGDA